MTEFWVSLLNGAITNILQIESNCAVKATTCDCVSNIAPQVYASLPVRNPMNVFMEKKNLRNKYIIEIDPNGVEICIKLNMHNVWWYHKPFSCSNSSLFELDDSWFVEAIQYFVTCSELSLSLIYSCTVYQSTNLNTFLLWITGGQESVVYHVNSGTDFRRGQDCQVVCPENCWCLCVVSLP